MKTPPAVEGRSPEQLSLAELTAPARPKTKMKVSVKDLLGLERLEKQSEGRLDLKICTEDCSRGEAGVVTALLQRDLGSLSAGARVFAFTAAVSLLATLLFFVAVLFSPKRQRRSLAVN